MKDEILLQARLGAQRGAFFPDGEVDPAWAL